MMAKKQLMQALYIVANYGGDGVRAAHGESLVLFYLFYESAATYTEALKLLPTRSERTARRVIDSLENRGFVQVLKDKQPYTVQITDKGTDYCLTWLYKAEQVAKLPLA